MKTIEVVLSIDPAYFGGSETQTESFAFNLNKNIEKMFKLKSDYTLNQSGNTYRIITNNEKQLELDISSFIENNWHNTNVR
jgi:hypothetical protein